MVRCSNKSVAEILSSTGGNDNDMILLDRKITMATEGFTTDRFCELVLKDRSRLSKENALTICDYVIAMKREVNPRLSYKKNTIQFLSELSRAVGIEKKFIDMTRDDILCYLDNCRKPENEDPKRRNELSALERKPDCIMGIKRLKRKEI
jgi:uncharacterized protein YihD (DUF1040 family)